MCLGSGQQGGFREPRQTRRVEEQAVREEIDGIRYLPFFPQMGLEGQEGRTAAEAGRAHPSHPTHPSTVQEAVWRRAVQSRREDCGLR